MWKESSYGKYFYHRCLRIWYRETPVQSKSQRSSSPSVAGQLLLLTARLRAGFSYLRTAGSRGRPLWNVCASSLVSHAERRAALFLFTIGEADEKRKGITLAHPNLDAVRPALSTRERKIRLVFRVQVWVLSSQQTQWEVTRCLLSCSFVLLCHAKYRPSGAWSSSLVPGFGARVCTCAHPCARHLRSLGCITTGPLGNRTIRIPFPLLEMKWWGRTMSMPVAPLPPWKECRLYRALKNVAFIYKSLFFFIALLLTRLTHKHVASSPSHQGFLFRCQPVFLQVLIIFPLDVHKNTRGRGKKGKRGLCT